MSLVSFGEAKGYLRVDSSDEDAVIDILLETSEKLCADVARLTEDQWKEICGEEVEEKSYDDSTRKGIAAVVKGAVLYSLAYLYEHREEADHHDLTLTLRAILFAVREGVNF